MKTRLFSDIGADAATEVYRYCLGHALEVLNISALDVEIWLTETCSDPIFANHHCQLQRGFDLGERMLYALRQGLATGTDQPVLLIGSDCLDLKPAHLHLALESLIRHDLVFLPCVDGGFAMIGCRRIEQSLFDGVIWSSSSVLRQTLKNAEKLKLSVDMLETVRDIDTLQDLNHYPELRELTAS
ncbi:MAG: glycosyltransferase [Gammaproteobacteria bacterium]|nr:glycosyltransferase [Gammaproteobacteria bacterium]